MTSSANETVPRADHVRCSADELVVTLVDGRILSVPLVWFPRLIGATPEERTNFELLGEGQGIHWPSLDEDISIAGLLAGKSSFEHRRRRIA